jgi:hypothetical protein
MQVMMRKLIMMLLVGAMLLVQAGGNVASAQVLPPGAPPTAPPLPPLPTPPDLSLTRPPKMDELPTPHNQILPRGSFSDRVTNCRQQAVAGGLNGSDREIYTRSCAN